MSKHERLCVWRGVEITRTREWGAEEAEHTYFVGGMVVDVPSLHGPAPTCSWIHKIQYGIDSGQIDADVSDCPMDFPVEVTSPTVNFRADAGRLLRSAMPETLAIYESYAWRGDRFAQLILGQLAFHDYRAARLMSAICRDGTTSIANVNIDFDVSFFMERLRESRAACFWEGLVRSGLALIGPREGAEVGVIDARMMSANEIFARVAGVKRAERGDAVEGTFSDHRGAYAGVGGSGLYRLSRTHAEEALAMDDLQDAVTAVLRRSGEAAHPAGSGAWLVGGQLLGGADLACKLTTLDLAG
ncbi:hypothetical protein A3709_20705 [Halioglobus sp. HI00S01]|uniref:hypothetical protein n=1 Tax=Halioglobus sp. HI00S01 TaxID=1822214 RepID=UPI0007C3FEF2|nr:hypothetical protein [Halioglobus sp. HI00S01]KZX58035.1 hypothetical protein A3709_20705 [Halioglobus sp. HI00S01]